MMIASTLGKTVNLLRVDVPAVEQQVVLKVRFANVDRSAALQLVNVQAGDAVMVGDSVRQDVEGALGAGMRAVLLNRGDRPAPREADLRAQGVPIIRSLRDLPHLVIE